METLPDPVAALAGVAASGAARRLALFFESAWGAGADRIGSAAVVGGGASAAAPPSPHRTITLPDAPRSRPCPPNGRGPSPAALIEAVERRAGPRCRWFGFVTSNWRIGRPSRLAERNRRRPSPLRSHRLLDPFVLDAVDPRGRDPPLASRNLMRGPPAVPRSRRSSPPRRTAIASRTHGGRGQGFEPTSGLGEQQREGCARTAGPQKQAPVLRLGQRAGQRQADAVALAGRVAAD